MRSWWRGRPSRRVVLLIPCPPATSPASASAPSATTPPPRSISIARHLVLTGPNGAGKTNLLEAVSLLSPGRGLRRAASRRSPPRLRPALGGRRHHRDPRRPRRYRHRRQRRDGGRRVRINGANARTIEEMSDYLRLLWLTPVDGRPLHRPRRRPPPLPRPAGDDADPRPFRLGRRLRHRDCASATSCSRTMPTRAGSPPSKPRWRPTPPPSTSPAPTPRPPPAT